MVVQSSRDLDMGENILRCWLKELTAASRQALLGQGQLRPEQQEIVRLRPEVAKLKAGARYPKELRRSKRCVDGGEELR